MEWDWLGCVTYWNFVGERSRRHYWREDFFCNSRIFPTNYFLMIFLLSFKFCILSLLVSQMPVCLFWLCNINSSVPARQLSIATGWSITGSNAGIHSWRNMNQWVLNNFCSGRYDINRIFIDQIEKNCNINIVIRVKLFALPIGISVGAFLARRIVTVCCG